MLLYHSIKVLKFKINKIIMENEKLIDLALKISKNRDERAFSELFDFLAPKINAYYLKNNLSFEQSEELMKDNLNPEHKEFIDFVLGKYVESGIEELDLDRLSELLIIKYKSIHDAQVQMGNAEDIKESFINFQRYLY